MEAEGLGPPGELLGDRPEAEQAERPPLEPARLPELRLVPVARPELGDVVRDPAVEREDEPERELGDRDRVPAGTVRDVDPALRCGRDVDRVVPRAGPDDERQVIAVHHRGGHLRRPDDEHLRLGLGERGHEGVVS